MKTLYTTYNNFAKRLVMSLMVLMTVGVGSVWGETATFTWGTKASAYTSGSTSFSEGQVTFTGTKGTGSTATRAWSDGLRMYAGSTAEFSVPNGYIITKIEGYTTFNFNNPTGQQSVKFTNLSKSTCINDVTVTYKSSAEEYTITWNNGGRGTTPTSPTSASEVALPTLTTTGYTNTGWTANVAVKNGTTTVAAGTLINNGTTVTLLQATTFTAQWTPKQITITWNANGGSVTPTTSSYTYDGSSVTLPTPTRDGYNFKGWYTSASGGSQITEIGTTNKPTTNVIYYAQWTEKRLTNYRTSCTTETIVTLDPNGGTISNTDGWTENGNGTYSKTHEGTEIALPTATKTNYIFDGWYNGETKYESIPSDLVESITLTAKWLEKQDAGIYWDPESVTVTIDADGNILPEFNNPNEIDGIEFSSSNPSVVAVDANGVITLGSTGTTATVTITATFDGDATYAAKEATCTLTVNPSNCRWVETEIGEINSGDEVLVTMRLYNGDTYTLDHSNFATEYPPAVAIHVNGNEATFLSTSHKNSIWNISGNATDGYILRPNGDSKNALYCTSTKYNVKVGTNNDNTFIIDGGYLKNTIHQVYVGVYNSSDWRHYPANTGNAIANQTLKFYKRECLDSEHYWVTWDANEGTWTDGSSNKLKSYQVGVTITAPTENPTREGYRFDGWTPAPTIMPAQNTTFTAKWTEVYTITWYENGIPSYTEVPSDNPVVTWEDNIADCGKKKFYGWTADDTFVSDPTTPPTLISKGTTIAGDVTYYAVYADAEVPANPGYTKVTTISEGTYLIATDATTGKAYTGKSGSNTYGGYCAVEIVDNVIEEPESAVEVEVTLNGSNFYMHDGTYYLGYTSGNAMTFDASIQTGNQNIWKLTTDEGYIESVNVSGRILQYNSGSPRFACYTSDQKKAYLYKKQTTTYKNFAVSCATYDISVTTPTGGTVTTNPAVEAGAGQTITVNVTPADCKYLTVLKYNYNDGSDHNINIASTPYTFTMPAADVTVTATFADKNATDIEILTSAHRMLMQGSAFVGEQVRITYNNGDKETLNWNDSRLTFTGHNTATLGSQTVTITYNGCGTQSASYDIEVIDGLGITFWDGDYTETIKYEPGDLVDVDNRIGQNICSGWEFAGWSETKVANESDGFVPVHNFNANDPKTLYAVYVQTSTDWISAYNIDELHSGAKYVIVYHYDNSKEYALTNTNNTNSSYLDGANLTTDCEQVREGDAYPYKDRYKLKVTPQPSWKWQLENTGSGWTMRNISANKYLKINSDKTISLTTTANDKFTLSNGNNDSEITALSSSNNYLSWYNSYKYWNGHTSGQQYYLTNETNFTSTPPCSPLSATFHGNGGIVTDGVNSGDNLTITEPTRDAGITTPTASFADCNGKSWTFVGWARKEIDVTHVPVLTTDLLHDGGGNKHYKIQEDGEEFWAVFTNTGDPETKYGTITFTDADVTREYTDAKTITKSVTAMGDYDFELYHVSNASSKGIQFDHDNATKGYIKNITSLGKINSISLNDFQTGDIDDVKVYVGNMPNAINTLLTEADLQQTGNTYTYYPQKNYAYVKIEANGYCGITSISIDFGKGTQIWATTPDCSTITLSGDELYVTSTNGQSIRAAERLTVKAVQLESKAKVVISSNSSDIYFSDVQDANFTQAVKPTETLTLTTDVDGNLSATEIYVHYRPSVDGTGIPEDVVVSANLETPNPGITDDHTIHVRNLPATFAIVAKVGNVWYALPSQGLNSTAPPVAYPVEVDNMADPTAVVSVPANADWALRQVYTSSGSNDRFADNGEKLVFVNDANPQKALNASSTGNYLLTDAQYDGYHNTTNPGLYEWIPTTTDLETYQLTNEQRSRTLSVNTATVFGVHATDKAVEQVRFLPIQNRYTPAALQVVEWKENSVVIMYNGDPAQTASVSVSSAAAQNTTLSAAQRDIAVYELAANGLAANPTQRLSITIGTEKVIESIPYIISGSKNDIDVLSGTTVAARQEVAKVADLVILKGATLTAAGAKGNPYKFRNVTVYGGGKLVIPSDKGFGVNSLTLRIGGVTADGNYDYVYPEFVLNTNTKDAYTNTSGKINLDYLTTKEQYYTFVAPFAVQTKDIHYPVDIYGNNVTANNRGSFEFQYYDGAARAAGEKGWKVVEEDPTDGATLTAHQGYTFYGMPKKVSVNGGTSTRQKFGIHRIPMSVTAANVMTHENTAQTTAVSAYPSQHNINAGWNLIGNPYMSTISGLDNQSIQTGTIVLVDNRWQWSDQGTQANRFIVFPSNDGEWYYASQASNATLPAFKNFFVQIANEAGNTLAIPRNTAMAQLLAPARRTVEEIEHDIEMAIVLEKDDAFSDQMDFLINDAYGAGFDYNADFTKMMNNTNLNLFGVHMDDYLSFVAIDTYTARSSVAIGYQAPQAGQYTLRISDKPYVMWDKIEALYVTDHEATPEVTTNLLDEAYTFQVSNAETNTTRFSISIVPNKESGGTTTAVDDILHQDIQTQKFIYNDQLYILRGGVVYDALGQQVMTINR